MGRTGAGTWVGRVLSAVVVLFLTADGLVGLLRPAMLRASAAETGYAFGSLAPISLIPLVCGMLYAIPATAPLGAILTTGFLGGAISSHVRVDAGVTPPEIVSAVVGILAWLGLWLRDPRLRGLLPLSS